MKKQCTDMLGVIGSLAIFAGGLMIATEFIIQCPGARLQILLSIISVLFLASVLGIAILYLILWGIDDDYAVFGNRWGCLILKFCIVGLVMVTAFILPAATLMVAVQGPHVVRILGLVLMGILIAGSIVIGVMISCAKQADQRRV